MECIVAFESSCRRCHHSLLHHEGVTLWGYRRSLFHSTSRGSAGLIVDKIPVFGQRNVTILADNVFQGNTIRYLCYIASNSERSRATTFSNSQKNKSTLTTKSIKA